MKVLVTGGAGFIGSHVVDVLVADGATVVVLDDLSGGTADNVPSGASLVVGSVTDAPLVDALFEAHDFRHVFHLAAYAAEGLSHFIRRFNYTVNVIGSVNLVNAAVRGNVERFVFTSSIAVYGEGTTGRPFRESDTPAPADPYGISKHAVEQDLEAARRLFGLDYTIFRPHNVYGERQNVGDPYRNVVGIFMRQILDGEPMTLFGDGSQTRAFTYVRDVAEDIARSIRDPGMRNRTFNIGSDDVLTVSELAVRVARAMDVTPSVRHLEARVEAHHAAADHALLAALRGPHRAVSIDEGLARMAAWVKQVGVRRSPKLTDIEVDKNMPEAWR
jgi:UDP-glucose 4-epimerase